jgi:hypothetical protein
MKLCRSVYRHTPGGSFAFAPAFLTSSSNRNGPRAYRHREEQIGIGHFSLRQALEQFKCRRRQGDRARTNFTLERDGLQSGVKLGTRCADKLPGPSAPDSLLVLGGFVVSQAARALPSIW